MRKLVFVLLACVTPLACITLSASVAARTVEVPPNDPAIAMTLPPAWQNDEIDYGYSAMSANNDVFISVEYAEPDDVAAMMKLNDDWMKKNSIKPVPPTKEAGLLNNIPVTHFGFDTTDDNGPTLIDFYMMPAGNDVAMITIWGSIEEREHHKADLDAFIASIKPADQTH